MPGRMRGAVRFQTGFLVLGVLLTTLGSFIWFPGSGGAMQEPGGDAAIRVVHGVADAGALDVYVNGSLALIGIVFSDTSGDLAFPAGEHELAVVQTGGSREDAIAAGTISLQSDTRSYATLLGTADAASVGIFPIDERPLDPGRARFRVISGVPDAEEIIPVFAGGDALSEPLGFGDATQYTAIDAGTYDLDVLDAASGASLLTLPQTPLSEGTTTDLILVGLAGDGSLRGLVQPIQVEVTRPRGSTAQIVAGDCEARQSVVADLGVVQTGQGDPVGAAGGVPVVQGFGVAVIPFAALLATPHAITVTEDGAEGGDAVACGEIGGNLTDTGALVVALQTVGADAPGGVAVLAPALEDPNATGVSIFLMVGGTTANTQATPVAAIE